MEVAEQAVPEPTSISASNDKASAETVVPAVSAKPDIAQSGSSPESKDGSMITAAPSVATSAPSSSTSVVAPGTITDLNAGQQQYFVVSMPVMSADGRTLQGVSTGIGQVGGTVVGTVVQPRSMAAVPASSLIGPQPAGSAKTRAVPPRGPQTRAAVGIVKAGTAPKAQAIVARATQPNAPNQPTVVKMVSVVQPAGTTLQVPNAASQVRRTSPAKGPVKQVSLPAGRPLAVRPGALVTAGVPGTSTTSPIVVGPSVVKKQTVVRASVPNLPTKSVVKPSPGPVAPVVKLPPANKNLASTDKALQYRRAVADSQAKLRKLEAAMAKAHPDRATPFSIGEIFSQAAVSFCKLSALSSHISLESMAPKEQRVWTPELITKFFGVIQTAAAGLKEVGDEVKKKHDQRIVENLKRKAESEGGQSKKASPDVERAPALVNGSKEGAVRTSVASSSEGPLAQGSFALGKEPIAAVPVPPLSLPNGVPENVASVATSEPAATSSTTISSGGTKSSDIDDAVPHVAVDSVRPEEPLAIMDNLAKEEAADIPFPTEDMEHVDIQDTETVVDSDVVLDDGIIPNSESHHKADSETGGEILGGRPLDEISDS